MKHMKHKITKAAQLKEEMFIASGDEMYRVEQVLTGEERFMAADEGGFTFEFAWSVGDPFLVQRPGSQDGAWYQVGNEGTPLEFVVKTPDAKVAVKHRLMGALRNMLGSAKGELVSAMEVGPDSYLCVVDTPRQRVVVQVEEWNAQQVLYVAPLAMGLPVTAVNFVNL